MKTLPLLAVAMLVSLAPAASAADFEGIVHMKLTDSQSSHDLTYQVKTGYVRTDMEAGQGRSASMIMDFKQQRMIILIPGQNMYMTRPLPSAPAAPAAAGGSPAAAPQKTGETKTILGYACTKYLSTAKGENIEMWVTDQLGNFGGFGGGGMGGRGGPPPAWESAIVGRGFFPMLITGKSASGASFSMEVVSVEPQSLPDSLFAPPAGARELNMGNMMGAAGMMGGQQP